MTVKTILVKYLKVTDNLLWIAIFQYFPARLDGLLEIIMFDTMYVRSTSDFQVVKKLRDLFIILQVF